MVTLLDGNDDGASAASPTMLGGSDDYDDVDDNAFSSLDAASRRL